MAQILDDCEKFFTEGHIELVRGNFNKIEGITSQALDDFKSLTPLQCVILSPIARFVS